MMILIGGDGFIGRNLRRILPTHSDVVIVSRNVARAAHATQAHKSVTEHFLDTSSFQQEGGDRLIESAKAIVYLATTSVPMTPSANPASEITDNVEPALRFFARCAALRTKARIVLVSSGGTVYGNGHATPIVESAPLRPVSAYGFGKVLIEQALELTGRTFGLKGTILRVANAVGPYHVRRDQGLVPIALRLSRTGGTLSVRGDGRSLRDYVHSQDIARAILAACASTMDGIEIFNIGSGVAHSTINIVDIITRLTDANLNINFIPASSNDVSYAVLNISAAQRGIDWRPKFTLEDAISDVWDEMRGLAHDRNSS